MQDEGLWQAMKTAPTACATQKHGLEHAILKSMTTELGLKAERGILALWEYRRFRYLLAVSTEQLLPSPLIGFIWARDKDAGPAYEATGFFPSDFAWHPDYQRTLDLYREEFGTQPMAQVWPPLAVMKQRRLALITLITGCLIFAAGEITDVIWITIFGSALLFASLLFDLANRHWGEDDRPN